MLLFGTVKEVKKYLRKDVISYTYLIKVIPLREKAITSYIFFLISYILMFSTLFLPPLLVEFLSFNTHNMMQEEPDPTFGEAVTPLQRHRPWVEDGNNKQAGEFGIYHVICIIIFL